MKASGGSPDPWVPYTPLLDLTFDYEGARYPLFVSEGTAEQKLAAIGSNAYLTFTYLNWVKGAWSWRDPLVVFGHRLSDSDKHLIQPIVAQAIKAEEKGWTCPPLAISLVPHDEGSNQKRMNEYRQRLARDDIVFFDATTHPLGASAQ